MAAGGDDRRRAPRVFARLTLSSVPEGSDASFAMETVDISASGAYCLVDRFVPLMTRVNLSMDLPENPHGHAAEAACVTVRAEGIVVRVEQNAEGNGAAYRLALFFSALEGDGRSRLEDFVRSLRDRRREI